MYCEPYFNGSFDMPLTNTVLYFREELYCFMKGVQSVKIEIIVGSTRQKRFAEKPANWIYELARKRQELDVELVDLRDYPLPFFDEPTSPARMEGKYSNELVRQW